MSNNELNNNLLESLSGGKNLLIYDDDGKESVMVCIPKFKISDVIDGGCDEVHPAFIINGEEKECIYVSKYQNIVENEKAYSLPFKDPAVLYSFNEVKEFCENKGKKWHLMTNAEWAAVALWSKKNKSLPRGNNNNGSEYSMPHERGVLISLNAITPEGEQGPPMRVATGSGPVSWSHNGSESGIYDLNGNVWEFVSGVRIIDSAINIIKDNNAAICDISEYSKQWRGISEKGNLTNIDDKQCVGYKSSHIDENGIADTILSFDTSSCDADASTFMSKFSTIQKKSEITNTSLLESLCLYPDAHNDAKEVLWGVSKGMKLPIRGGYWVNGEMAGVFSCGFYMDTDSKYFDVGFRACYYD